MTRQDDLRKMVAEATQGPWTHHEIDDWTVSDEVQAQKHEVVCCNTKYYPTGVSRENCRLIAQAPTLATDLAAALDKIERLEGFIGDFAAAKIDALRYSPPHGASPEDEPDPVVDAETVWAWQADAKAALTTGDG